MITWAGDVPGVEELGKIDVFLHTSHYESLPYVLLEATAAEIPVVAVENSGSLAVFGDLLPGAIIRNSEPSALADAVMELLPGKPARLDHIERLRALADEFTIQKMVKSTIDVYEELLSRSTATSKR
jgi:glycosyltransferase involved in cell wall biosynthesis